MSSSLRGNSTCDLAFSRASASHLLLERFRRPSQQEKADNLTSHLPVWTVRSLSLRRRSYLVLGPLPFTCCQALFDFRQPGPWRRKRHFEANFSAIPTNEGVSESPRPPASNALSGAGIAGRLGTSRSYFLSSIDRRRRPRCCSGSYENG